MNRAQRPVRGSSASLRDRVRAVRSCPAEVGVAGSVDPHAARVGVLAQGRQVVHRQQRAVEGLLPSLDDGVRAVGPRPDVVRVTGGVHRKVRLVRVLPCRGDVLDPGERPVGVSLPGLDDVVRPVASSPDEVGVAGWIDRHTGARGVLAGSGDIDLGPERAVRRPTEGLDDRVRPVAAVPDEVGVAGRIHSQFCGARLGAPRCQVLHRPERAVGGAPARLEDLIAAGFPLPRELDLAAGSGGDPWEEGVFTRGREVLNRPERAVRRPDPCLDDGLGAARVDPDVVGVAERVHHHARVLEYLLTRR